LAAVFTTIHPSKVKTMDAVILFDYKQYDYLCASCDWFGTELELDVVTKIKFNQVCCPICQSNDVSVHIEKG
jgi:Zn finger protein HypA/HybF involved in hydrogenase expression